MSNVILMRDLVNASGDAPTKGNSEETRWIANTFKKKECKRYVKKDQTGKCYCGRQEDEHKDTVHSDNGALWDKKNDVRECPNDSFGKINFVTGEASSKVAHYVRVSDDTDPKDVLDLLLLEQHWNLPKPHLAISVEGGTKNFELSKHYQDIFNRGLANAAKTEDAWIFTKGYYCGVHKAVGEAVREGQMMSWSSNKGGERDQIYCIGIGPWGYVENSKSLVGKKEEGLYPAQYKVNPIVKRKMPVSLDPHHTHFLLVDDGTKTSYGYDIPFRAKLEKEMTEPTERRLINKTGAIPVVKICLGGGEDTIKSAKVAVENQIPVVFCEGTGRAADLLAEACKNCVLDNGVRKINPSERNNVHRRIQSVCQIREDDPKKNEIIQDLKEAIDVIIRHETMITVFSMDGGEQAGLDLAILKALLKGKAAKPERQLELALSWDRADVAKSVFEGNNEWKPDSYDGFVTNALKENQVDFLQLFLEKGAIMKEYLTVRKLSNLYNEEKDVLFRKLLSERGSFYPVKDSFILHNVSSIIRSLTGAHHYNYSISTHCLSGSTPDDVQSKLSTNESSEFKHPFTELFLWAILGSRMDLAEFLWERSENPVCLAVVALRMTSSMSKKDKDKRTFLKESAR